MIRCPSCGTFNHDSQRVCRSCGSALPQTRRRCPECGALNPVGNLFCDRCNARLVDIEDITPASASDSALNVHTGVKGISLPMRPVTSNEEAPRSPELPAWLAGLVDEDTEFGLSDSGRDEGESAAQEPVLDASVLPDWLGGDDGLSSAGGAVDVPSLPDWLAGGADEIAGSQHDAASAEGELPAWPGRSPGPIGLEPMFPASPEPYTSDDDGIVALQGTPDSAPAEEATDAEIISEAELPDYQGTSQQLAFTSSGTDAIEGGDEEPVPAEPPGGRCG